jgi:hypothetical protein
MMPFAPRLLRRPAAWSGRPSTLVLALALVAAGCASGGGSARPTPVYTTIPEGEIVEGRLLGTDVGSTALSYSVRSAIPGPVDALPGPTFTAVQLAYENLELPIAAIDTLNGRVLTAPIQKSGRFVGEKLSKWVDCGQDAQGFERADSYRITMRIGTSVGRKAENGKTTIQTLVTADARGAGVRTDRFDCRTTGELEKRILEETRKLAIR